MNRLVRKSKGDLRSLDRSSDSLGASRLDCNSGKTFFRHKSLKAEPIELVSSAVWLWFACLTPIVDLAERKDELDLNAANSSHSVGISQNQIELCALSARVVKEEIGIGISVLKHRSTTK